MNLTQSAADVIVVGAGIVGAACAMEFARRNLRVLVIDDASVAATAAGMGHLVAMDDSPAELALCNHSLALWARLGASLPKECAYQNVGTYWVAKSEAEMSIAESRRAMLAEHGVECHLIGAGQLRASEPMLDSSLLGALCVPGDGVVYAPAVAEWMLLRSKNISRLNGRATGVTSRRVELASGQMLSANVIVVANGLGALRLFPELGMRPKKGHLLISDRYPGLVHHQIVELGYASSAHASEGTSVAFNVQPRPTGQLLIGSSRQFDTLDAGIEMDVLAKMLRRAVEYMPAIKTLNAIRSWTGFRVATQDGLPIIGKHPNLESVWLAVGHEGLGVTTAPATGDLLAAMACGERPEIDPSSYAAGRFLCDSVPAVEPR